ncbi:GDSL esterase/lipase At3g27950 [Medicago truncatula]|uniref:GDSL-like lipase/acylhydrolase n=1 Tax=Medicago truncatula TaxID=3880 RepID=G7LFU3_MEDTR|nr:GDSL esterase/lipase At3g27950 [Medicago truncatula]AET01439.2 GDSL-like lipase/acylhydrolase [Medicago truncatula]
MNTMTLIYILCFFNLCVACPSKKCVYPAIYNFGDSNSDTGAGYATMAAVEHPNGISFFGSISGRCCDGRLILDFISEELELPYLSSYLNSVGSNYRHGANFAVASAPIRPIIAGLTYLGFQVSQFILFKSHTKILFDQLSDKRTEPPLRSGVPRTEDFSKAIYTIDIGQNDIGYGLQKPNSSEEEVRRSIPDILSQFTQAVQKLYNEEARVFWIHNTGPIECIPYYYFFYPHKNEKGNLDANGCVKPHNELAQEYNRQLKDQVFQLRRMFPLAKFTYVDVYTVKYTLISNARNQGFVNPLEFCCGSYQGNEIHYCGKKSIKNGTVYGIACDDSSTYIPSSKGMDC